MKNRLNGYDTGIDDTSARRTVIEAIKFLKSNLDAPVFTVTGGHVEQSLFTDVINTGGKVYLAGVNPSGSSLYELYRYETACSGDSALDVRKMAGDVFQAALEVGERTGTIPGLLLNGVFYDRVTGETTFLPARILDYLTGLRIVELSNLLTVCTAGRKEKSGDRDVLLFQTARLLYLFLGGRGTWKDQKGDLPPVPPGLLGGPLYDIRSLDMSAGGDISDFLWNILHKKKHRCEAAGNFPGMLEERPEPSPILPLLRRRRTVELLFAVRGFFHRRWKLIAATAAAAAVLLYLISDIYSSRVVVQTSGLQPLEIVELYYEGMRDLDINIIDAVYYRGSGRKLKNEISTLYVTSKMEQVYNRKMSPSDEDGLPEEDGPLFQIRELSISQVSDGENPVFTATYMRVVNGEGGISEASLHETIYLKKYRDSWYIIESTRTVEDDGESR